MRAWVERRDLWGRAASLGRLVVVYRGDPPSKKRQPVFGHQLSARRHVAPGKFSEGDSEVVLDKLLAVSEGHGTNGVVASPDNVSKTPALCLFSEPLSLFIRQADRPKPEPKEFNKLLPRGFLEGHYDVKPPKDSAVE